MTLTGHGVGHATTILLPEPGLAATIVPSARPDDNRVEIDLTIARNARVGLHSIGVMTPLGVPGFQTFAVAADPELREQEPNDRVDQLKLEPKPGALPATLLGTIDRPGDVDLFPFEAKAGEELVFQVVARAIGSQLRPALVLIDRDGNDARRGEPGGRRRRSGFRPHGPV